MGPETEYQHRTDSVETKLSLLKRARESGDLDLAMSLAESIKHTLSFERQSRDEQESVIDAATFQIVEKLPSEWAEWANGWSFFKVVEIREQSGLARKNEPVDIRLSFAADQVTDVQREIRVAKACEGGGILRHVPSQVYGAKRIGSEVHCNLVFMADIAERGVSHFVILYGNPLAELPNYSTDLKVSGEGYALDIENEHFAARLSRQMGQLERLNYKWLHGLELFAGGEGHGEPPNIDWAHDYLASNGFQKFRVTNWASCPNYEVVRGPLCVKVRRWGFPHSPAHPLFTPSRMHIDVTYTFYAGQPWFRKVGSMDMVQDFELHYLRDDEWVFSGYSFDESLWMDREGRLHEGSVPPEHQDDLWGVGFYHGKSRQMFFALWLEHYAENFDGLHHAGAPELDYRQHGQLWSRWAARDNPQFKEGASLNQHNAYLTGMFLEETGAADIELLRQKLLHPLTAGPGELPDDIEVKPGEALARPGETESTAPLKNEIWAALREVPDDMFYKMDANVADMGYIYDVRVRGHAVHILMTMPHHGRPKYDYLGVPIRERLLQIKSVREVFVEFTWQPAWDASRLNDAGRKAMGIGS